MQNENIGDIRNVVVDKLQLLSIIKDNKAKHDAIFESAVSGYWIEAKDRVNQKKAEFSKYTNYLTSLFNTSTDLLLKRIEDRESLTQYSSINVSPAYMNYSINLKYPESYDKEYNRAIRSVELNVYDKIELSEQEFNQYVMNDWSWKNSFISSNSAYVNTYIFSGAHAITGCYSSNVLTSGCNFF